MRGWAGIALAIMAGSGCLRGDGVARGGPCTSGDAVWSQDVLVDNMVGGGPGGGSTGQTWTIDTRSQTGWRPAQADCVRAIRVDATWTNGATSGADLYIGIVVPGTDTEVLGHDRQQAVLDGTHTETVFAPTAVDGFHGEALLGGLDVTLYTQWAGLSSGGLPVNVTVTLVVP